MHPTERPAALPTRVVVHDGIRASAYPDLESALWAVGLRGFRPSEDGRAVVRDWDWSRPPGTFLFRDAWGDVVPPAKVIATARELSGRSRCRFMERRRVDFSFREGPVPGTGKRVWGGYFRPVRTTQERREAAGLEADMEAKESGVRCRPRRSAALLPDTYDDIPRADPERSWKSHRRTQWKG